MKNHKLLTIISLLVILWITRLVPHVPNFTAASAIVVFLGVIYGQWKYFIPILLGYFACDLWITNFVYKSDSAWFGSLSLAYLYIPYIINFIISKYLHSDHKISTMGIVRISLISSVIFFLVSNFGVWMTDALYPKTISGLLLCYWAAIPFFAYEFVATLFFSVSLFSIASVLTSKKTFAFELQ